MLELGSRFADSSHTLCTATSPGGSVCLVDIVRSDAKSGRNNQRNVDAFRNMERVTMIELSSLEDWKDVIFAKNQQSPSNFDIIAIDLGHMIGNDLYLSTLTLANELLSVTSPRVVIIKSQSLSSLSRRLIPAQHVLEGLVELDTNGQHDTKQPNEPIILASVGVEEYRRLIPKTVKAGDVVLEVGCHFGRTTHLLNQATSAFSSGAGYCVGVDIGPKIIKNAQSQYPDILFAVEDAWKTFDLLKLRQDKEMGCMIGYDVVYIDIGGLSGAHGTLEALSLLEALTNALKPRCIVIKSLCMKRLASRLKPFQSIWAKINSDLQ